MQTLDFDWNDLRFFLAVAETGNLARGAARLRVNHSTMFRRLRAMESRLGVLLFDRQSDGYVLTEAGERALSDAKAAEQAVADLQRRVAGHDVSPIGPVRMTTASKLATEFVASAMPALAKLHPGIRLEVLVSDFDYDLKRREADFALRATNNPPPHLVGREVARLPWLVMASPNYLEQHARPRKMADLAEHRLLGGDESFERLPIFRSLRKTFSPDCFVASSNDLSTIAAMARAGLGLAVLPVDQLGSGLMALFSPEPAYFSSLWILSHPDLHRAARVRAVTRFLYKHLSQDPRLIPYATARPGVIGDSTDNQ